MPTAFLLESLLAAPSSASLDSAKTVLHLQDFNLPVLALVTLPNLLLAALHHVPVEALRPAANTPDVEETLPDDEVEGILTITPALKAAFKKLLEERGVEMRFSYGHWGALAQRIEQEGKRYGLVLTAETIYEESSVPSLLWLLKASSSTPGQPGNAPRRLDVAAGADELETGVGALSVSRQWASTTLRDQPNAVILVAAKVSSDPSCLVMLISTGAVFWGRRGSADVLGGCVSQRRVARASQGVDQGCGAEGRLYRMDMTCM